MADADESGQHTQWNIKTFLPVMHWTMSSIISLLQCVRCGSLVLHEGSLLAAMSRLVQCLFCLAISVFSVYVLRIELNDKDQAVKSRGLFFTILHLLRAIGFTMLSCQPLRSPTDEDCGIPDIDMILMLTYYQAGDIYGLAPPGLMMILGHIELPWHLWLDFRYANLNLIAGSSTLLSYLRTRGIKFVWVRFVTGIIPILLDSSNQFYQECQLLTFLLSGAFLFKASLQIGILLSYGKTSESSWDVMFTSLAMFFFMSADYRTMLKLAHRKLEDMKTAISQAFHKKSEEEIIQEVKDIANLVNAAGAGASEEAGGADKVELFESIGGGAHGTVFKGRWRGMDVAVKTVMFPYEHGSDKSARQRAVLEAGVSCSIVHPNIVTTLHWDIKAVHTSNSTPSSSSPRLMSKVDSSMPSSISLDPSMEARDWKLYLVQELCQASLNTLQQSGLFVIPHGPRQGQPLMLNVLSTLMDVAKGLEHLHSKGIIHGWVLML